MSGCFAPKAPASNETVAADGVASLIRKYIESGGKAGTASVTCADGSCTITDTASGLTCTDGSCYVK